MTVPCLYYLLCYSSFDNFRPTTMGMCYVFMEILTYSLRANLQAPFGGANLTQKQKPFNKSMSQISVFGGMGFSGFFLDLMTLRRT